MACYHDEIKICLPALLTLQHHLLFTFFHTDLQTKLEAPKPVSPPPTINKVLVEIVDFIINVSRSYLVFLHRMSHYVLAYLSFLQRHLICCKYMQVVVGYAALPLSTHIQYVSRSKLNYSSIILYPFLHDKLRQILRMISSSMRILRILTMIVLGLWWCVITGNCIDLFSALTFYLFIFRFALWLQCNLYVGFI